VALLANTHIYIGEKPCAGSSELGLSDLDPAPSAPAVEPEPQLSITPTAPESTGAPMLFPAWAFDRNNWTTDRTTQRVTARSLLLAAVEGLVKAENLTLEEARHRLARDYNAGTMVVPERVRELVRHLSRSTLANWAGAQRRGKLQPCWTGLKRAIPQDCQELILGILAAKPWLGHRGIARELALHWRGEMPSEGQIYRFVTDWKRDHPQEWALLQNPDTARGRVAPAFGTRNQTQRPNEIWEVDCTRVDLTVRTGETVRRWTLVALVDVFTRRAQVLLTPQPRGRATMQVVRKAILAWGLPETLKLDNGKEFKNNFVLQRLENLGISPWFCNPGNPQEKPFVERFFGTLQHGALESLPGFVGHNVGERKDIQKSSGEPGWAVAMEPGDLQTWLDKWLEQYHQTYHSGINCSPLEKLARALPLGWVQRTVDPTQLDFVLLPGSTNPDGLQRVGKNGLTVAGCHFVAPVLGGMVGRRVHVRFDPDDLSQVWVYDSPQLKTLICTAKNADGLSNLERAKVAREAKSEYAQAQKRVVEFRREGRKLDKKIRENPGILVQGPSAPVALIRRQVQELEADLRGISAPPPPADPLPRWEDVVVEPEPPPPPEPLHRVLTRVCDAWLEGESPDPVDCDRVAVYALTNPGQLLIKCALPSWDLRDSLTDFFKNYKKQTA